MSSAEKLAWVSAFSLAAYGFGSFLLEFPEPLPQAMALAQSHILVREALGEPIESSVRWTGTVRNQR